MKRFTVSTICRTCQHAHQLAGGPTEQTYEQHVWLHNCGRCGGNQFLLRIRFEEFEEEKKSEDPDPDPDKTVHTKSVHKKKEDDK